MSLFTYSDGTTTKPTPFTYFFTALVIGAIVALVWMFAIPHGGATPSISTPNQPSAPSAPNQPGAVAPGGTVGQVTIPADLSATGKNQKITVNLASDWPRELAASLNPELANLGQIKILGTITNSSPYTVNFNEIVYSLDSEKVNHNISGLTPLNGFNLVPGQKMTVQAGFMPGVAKTVTIKVLGFKRLTGPQTTPVTPIPTTPVPTVTPTPTPTQWPMTIQVDQGLLTINYRKTDSAEGKISVWVDKKEKILYQQNLLDRPLQGTIFVIRDGQSGSGPVNFRPNELISQKLGPGTLEFWYEVN